ncbi:MAG TPA: NlpC/P60 family protein [Rhodopila sp.]|nr:NlpC/P60 family protein [Rhodopila sp.]
MASTNLFLDRLLGHEDWLNLTPWVAAQQVQISAYDGRPRPENNFSTEVGGNYRANYAKADRVAQAIAGSFSAGSCDGGGGASAGALAPGSAASHGLPVGYTIPPASAPATEAVRAALTVLGRPYVWDAAGPESFDCSGLTMWAWSRAGVQLAHYTGSQFIAGSATSAEHLQPGDLVLIPGSDGTLADPQHVGMFIGYGLVVEAPQTGDVVKVVTFSSFISGGLSGLRHIE